MDVEPLEFEELYPNVVDAPVGAVDDLRVAFAARIPPNAAEDAQRSLGYYVARRGDGVWSVPPFEESLVPHVNCCLSGDMSSNQAGEAALVIQDASDANRAHQRMTLAAVTDAGFVPRWTWEVEYVANFVARPRVWLGADGAGFVFYVARDPESPCPAGPECAAGCTRLYRRSFDLRRRALGEVEVMSSVETGVTGWLEVASDDPESLVVSWWQSGLPAPSCGMNAEFGTLQVSEWLDGRWVDPRGSDDVVEPGRQRRFPPSISPRVFARRGPDGRLALLWTVDNEVQAAIREPDGRWVTSEECADPWPNNRVHASHIAWSPPGQFHFFFYDSSGAYEVTSP